MIFANGLYRLGYNVQAAVDIILGIGPLIAAKRAA